MKNYKNFINFINEKKSIIDSIIYGIENDDEEVLNLFKDKLMNAYVDLHLQKLPEDDFQELIDALILKNDVKYLKYLQDNGFDLFIYNDKFVSVATCILEDYFTKHQYEGMVVNLGKYGNVNMEFLDYLTDRIKDPEVLSHYFKYQKTFFPDFAIDACIKMGIFHYVADKLTDKQKIKYKEHYTLQKDFELFSDDD